MAVERAPLNVDHRQVSQIDGKVTPQGDMRCDRSSAEIQTQCVQLLPRWGCFDHRHHDVRGCRGETPKLDVPQLQRQPQGGRLTGPARVKVQTQRAQIVRQWYRIRDKIHTE